MRAVKLTLSNYLREKNEAKLEEEVLEIIGKITQAALNKIKKGEKNFVLSMKMTPAAYRMVSEKKYDLFEFEHINADKIDFNSSRPQCFQLKHKYKLF